MLPDGVIISGEVLRNSLNASIFMIAKFPMRKLAKQNHLTTHVSAHIQLYYAFIIYCGAVNQEIVVF